MLLRTKFKKVDSVTIGFWHEHGFTRGHPYANPALEPLKERLLGIYGKAVCLPFTEPDLDDIMKRGELWRGYRALMCRGEPCHCHANSGELWLQHEEDLAICTGYAMSDDAMWRQHTWCVQHEDDRVVETTTRRVLYYGYRMTFEEAEKFVEENPF